MERYDNERSKAIYCRPPLLGRIDAAKHGKQGQALVEMALLIPLLFLLIICAVNFGGLLYDWVTVAGAARAGAQYAALGASSVGSPSSATLSQVKAIVQQETSSLPNASSSNPTVTVCENNNGTVTALGGGSCPNGVTAPPADPEPSSYVTLAIDVTYTFTPFYSKFSFPALSIGLPTMPSQIHSRSVMRLIQ
ncbi:MAG: pilus assembly protein [Acidobacteriaceae bacterium]|nr:pilus assembly protein [Acidobacteriaceae bacterium]